MRLAMLTFAALLGPVGMAHALPVLGLLEDASEAATGSLMHAQGIALPLRCGIEVAHVDAIGTSQPGFNCGQATGSATLWMLDERSEGRVYALEMSVNVYTKYWLNEGRAEASIRGICDADDLWTWPAPLGFVPGLTEAHCERSVVVPWGTCVDITARGRYLFRGAAPPPSGTMDFDWEGEPLCAPSEP